MATRAPTEAAAQLDALELKWTIFTEEQPTLSPVRPSKGKGSGRVLDTFESLASLRSCVSRGCLHDPFPPPEMYTPVGRAHKDGVLARYVAMRGSGLVEDLNSFMCPLVEGVSLVCCLVPYLFPLGGARSRRTAAVPAGRAGERSVARVASARGHGNGRPRVRLQ